VHEAAEFITTSTSSQPSSRTQSLLSLISLRSPPLCPLAPFSVDTYEHALHLLASILDGVCCSQLIEASIAFESRNRRNNHLLEVVEALIEPALGEEQSSESQVAVESLVSEENIDTQGIEEVVGNQGSLDSWHIAPVVEHTEVASQLAVRMDSVD